MLCTATGTSLRNVRLKLVILQPIILVYPNAEILVAITRNVKTFQCDEGRGGGVGSKWHLHSLDFFLAISRPVLWSPLGRYDVAGISSETFFVETDLDSTHRLTNM
jgi:hypothetical protein